MPRDPKLVAGMRLEAAVTNWKKAKELTAKTRKSLDDSIVAAVRAGIPRYEIAKRIGVSPQTIGSMDAVRALRGE